MFKNYDAQNAIFLIILMTFNSNENVNGNCWYENQEIKQRKILKQIIQQIFCNKI